MDTDGTIGLCAADPEQPDRSTQQIIDAIHRGLRGRAEQGEIRAAAVCFDTRIARQPDADKVDAICVHVERVGKKPVDIYIPYTKGLFGNIKFQDAIGSGADAQIFMTGYMGTFIGNS